MMGGRGGHSHFGGGGGAGGGGRNAGKTVDQLRFQRRGYQIPAKIRKVLEERFASASETAKFIYDYYIRPGGEVSDPKYKDAQYLPPNYFNKDRPNAVPNSVEMYIAGDDTGQAWFHEHGHFVDFNMPSQLGYNYSFLVTLREDVKNYTSKILKEHDFSNDRLYARDPDKQMYKYELVLESIERESGYDQTNGVQDIFSGAWGRRVSYFYGHNDEYWQRTDYNLSIEAAANMFEALFDPKKSSAMQRYLPKSWALFNENLEKERRRLAARKY